jgi:hypothetical protein
MKSDRLSEIVLKYSDKYWDWKDLTRKVEFKVIEMLHDKDWDWPHVTFKASMEMLDRFQDKIYWELEELLENPNVTWEYACSHYTGGNLDHFMVNKNVDLKKLEELMEMFPYSKEMSYNPNITWEFVMKHRDRDWDWEYLSFPTACCAIYRPRYI